MIWRKRRDTREKATEREKPSQIFGEFYLVLANTRSLRMIMNAEIPGPGPNQEKGKISSREVRLWLSVLCGHWWTGGVTGHCHKLVTGGAVIWGRVNEKREGAPPFRMNVNANVVLYIIKSLLATFLLVLVLISGEFCLCTCIVSPQTCPDLLHPISMN